MTSSFNLQFAISILVLEFVISAENYQQNDIISYVSYMNGPVCHPSDEIRYPNTDEDIVSIIKEAIKRGTTVKAFGSRHSMTDIICTDGIPVSMKNFQKKVFNKDDNSVTFGAGVIMFSVAEFLNSKGRALRTIPIYGNITVGGAIGTGAHGSTVKYTATPSDQVIALTYVDGAGAIQKVKCKYALRAFRVHLGLLGIILDVTFKTVPFYKVLAHNYEISDKILTDGRALDFVRETDQICLFWFPHIKKVMVANWTNVDGGSPGHAFSNYVLNFTKETNILTSLALELLQTQAPDAAVLESGLGQALSYRLLIDNGATTPYGGMYTEDGLRLKNPAVGDWNRILSSTCPPDGGRIQCSFGHGKFKIQAIDNEIAVPLEMLPQVIHRIKDILKKAPAVYFSWPSDGMVFRFSGKSDTYMALNQGRDMVHVEFITNKRLKEYDDPMAYITNYQLVLQSLAFEFGGRSHWGKTGFFYHTRDMITRKLNPSAKKSFMAQMKKSDPYGIFMNKFGRRYLGESTLGDIDPKIKHCALEDNCVCQFDADCAKLQKCAAVKGYDDYNVCQNVVPGFIG